MQDFNFLNLIWIFFLISTIVPLLQRALQNSGRQGLIRKLERKRNSRVIVMIHRQERLSFLGIPLARYIDIEDSEQVLRAIRLTKPDVPIDIVLHTPGGLVLAAEQIAHALVRHQAPVTVMVPHYAMSGGTLLALASDQIIMDTNAVLGPVDPQLGQYPAASLLEVVARKRIDTIDDDTLVRADIAAKALRQLKRSVVHLLTANGVDHERAEALAEILGGGHWTHDYPITFEEARELGLPVRDDLPEEVYKLMELYPQPATNRPSVQYVPLPYRRQPEREPRSRDGQ
jgi:ClpP class serine protease